MYTEALVTMAWRTVSIERHFRNFNFLCSHSSRFSPIQGIEPTAVVVTPLGLRTQNSVISLLTHGVQGTLYVGYIIGGEKYTILPGQSLA